MAFNPGVYFAEVFGDWTSVEDIARCVAEMGNVTDKVHLSLQESDSIVQLGCYWESLICGCVSTFDEWRVMSRYFGDVGVFSGAKLGVVVTRRGVCSCGYCGC